MRTKIYRVIGNVAYKLNGGVENLSNKSRMARLTYWAWGKAWYYEEKAAGRL